MPATTLARRAQPSPLLAGLLLSGPSALALWGAILASEWPRLMATGTICGESGAWFGHCAACYPAAAASLIAAACAGALAFRRSWFS